MSYAASSTQRATNNSNFVVNSGTDDRPVILGRVNFQQPPNGLTNNAFSILNGVSVANNTSVNLLPLLTIQGSSIPFVFSCTAAGNPLYNISFIAVIVNTNGVGTVSGTGASSIVAISGGGAITDYVNVSMPNSQTLNLYQKNTLAGSPALVYRIVVSPLAGTTYYAN